MTIGVKKNGGRLHVRAPAVRWTRCGVSLRPPADVTEHEVDDVPGQLRCRKCFPGSGRRADDVDPPQDGGEGNKIHP